MPDQKMELPKKNWQKKQDFSNLSQTLPVVPLDLLYLTGHKVKRFNNQSVSEWIEVKGWYTLFKSNDLISVSVFTGWGFL